MRKIFIAIPSHTGTAEMNTVTSLVQSIAALCNLKIDWDFVTWNGDSLLPHARNVLVAKFMASDCTDLWWIDADVGWSMDALMALLNAPPDYELVAGMYRLKTDDEKYALRYLPGATQLDVDENGLAEVAGVPMGFARLNRAGAERIINSVVHKTYVHGSAPDYVCHLLFDLVYRDHQYTGEDYVFCEQFRAAGGRVYILDPELEFSHAGKKTFTGSLGASLRKKAEAEAALVARTAVYDKLYADMNRLPTSVA